MAYTKNHTIDATLKKAVDYICNPEKTDDTLLIHSYGCSPETADMEFEWTREKSTSPTPHLARHLIQSFSPGETTPEQAHEIGKRLADEVLGGRFEYVLTTHIDKGHIHNHIIFNDVSFVDYKHSHVNRRWNKQTRHISDNLCKEYGLSIIPPNKNKGKSYIEYSAARKGTSWKAQLKADIDKAISRSTDFEDFLLRMEIADYEIKRGKYISFRAKGKERFTRGKTLGERYTEDSIRERIEKNRTRKPRTNSRRINLLIDIQNCIKAQESKGYEHWAKINNLKQASKTLNYLTEHNIKSYAELEQTAEKIHTDFDAVSAQIKSTEKQMNDTAVLMKNVDTYTELKPVYDKYRTAKNKSDFENKYRREIILFRTAAKNLKGKNPPSAPALKNSYAELNEQKAALYEEYKKLKKQSAEIDIVKQNVDMLLGDNLNKERTQEHEIE
ncbi:relaxase/mobilization nuclease domain-containing protein [Eubacterium sp. BL-380-WT-2B]|uniref:relaxase/mobilization nuclease domain-containing protein n=1 Tax=Eubacterium sp. BL-380-WT-2B TaxID=2605785 RepID=UPI0012B3B984|nr:relaxase/mobilization nuclease domain-containing protein [Eubacterium sp. BL-380-WT-2B]MBD8947181.1 endonuclease [Clostridiales bacterium]MSS95015.1 relaxase/mobilization nuclease domain-containing protein [Eubacterium sp. BL-380-WT-2B]